MPVDRDGSPFHELDLEELWKGVSQLASHINRGVKGVIQIGQHGWH